MHYLVFHLTIADMIVSGITMPLEAIWRFTLQVSMQKMPGLELTE